MAHVYYGRHSGQAGGSWGSAVVAAAGGTEIADSDRQKVMGEHIVVVIIGLFLMSFVVAAGDINDYIIALLRLLCFAI